MSLVIPTEKRDAFGKNASYRIRQTGPAFRPSSTAKAWTACPSS